MSRPSRRRAAVTIAACCAIFASLTPSVLAGEFENLVRARWRGAWVVIDTEAYSDCGAGYTTNKVNGRLVTSRGRHRFEEGELAKVDRVQVKGKRVELHTSLDVELLAPFRDGPFTLYTVNTCRINVQLFVPRSTIKAKDVDAVDQLLTGVVERYGSRDDAYASDLWNGRELEAYPADYETTLARHAVWRAEQRNLSIDAKLDDSLENATALAVGVEDDPAYLSGFAAGTHALRAWTERDCGVLVDRGFAAARRPLPDDQKHETDEWKQGYTDGQRLVYSLALLERLGRCYVDVPSLPEPVEASAVANAR